MSVRRSPASSRDLFADGGSDRPATLDDPDQDDDDRDDQQDVNQRADIEYQQAKRPADEENYRDRDEHGWLLVGRTRARSVATVVPAVGDGRWTGRWAWTRRFHWACVLPARR